jgi:serine protease
MPKSLLTLAALCAVFLSPPLAQLHAQTVLAHPDARVIVKYKADSLLLRKRADSAATERSDRAEAMGMRVGLWLRAGESVAERTEVLLASGIGSEELAARIKAQSDVEYAVPDQRRRRTTVPNDPLYLTGPPLTPALVPTSGGPVAGQWYLRAPAGDVQAGANVEAAWNLSIGSPNVVVGRARYRRALRPPRPATRGRRRQRAAGLRHDQRCGRRQRRRWPRRRCVRSR